MVGVLFIISLSNGGVLSVPGQKKWQKSLCNLGWGIGRWNKGGLYFIITYYIVSGALVLNGTLSQSFTGGTICSRLRRPRVPRGAWL